MTYRLCSPLVLNGLILQIRAFCAFLPTADPAKRHLLTDTIGLSGAMIVHPADVQDRDGAPDLLASVRDAFPWLRRVFADGGYAGDKLKDALADLGNWTIEIVKRSDFAQGFVWLPRRWVVNACLPGRTETAGWPRTSKRPSRVP
jgi:transposase